MNGSINFQARLNSFLSLSTLEQVDENYKPYICVKDGIFSTYTNYAGVSGKVWGFFFKPTEASLDRVVKEIEDFYTELSLQNLPMDAIEKIKNIDHTIRKCMPALKDTIPPLQLNKSLEKGSVLMPRPVKEAPLPQEERDCLPEEEHKNVSLQISLDKGSEKGGVGVLGLSLLQGPSSEERIWVQQMVTLARKGNGVVYEKFPCPAQTNSAIARMCIFPSGEVYACYNQGSPSLGRGSYKTARIAQCWPSGEKVASISIDIQCAGRYQVARELKGLKLVKGVPGFIQQIGKEIYYTSKKGKEKVRFFTSLGIGDLKNLQDRFSIEQKLQIAYVLARRLKTLEEMGLVYTDLKLENIVLDKEGNLLLIDLQSLMPFIEPQDEDCMFPVPLRYIPTTAKFISPEYGKAKADKKDIGVAFEKEKKFATFSWATVIYDLFFPGKLPWNDRGKEDIYLWFKKYQEENLLWYELSGIDTIPNLEFEKVMYKAFTADYQKRPNMQQIVEMLENDLPPSLKNEQIILDKV